MINVLGKLEEIQKRNEQQTRGIIATGDDDLINEYGNILDTMALIVQKIELMLGKKNEENR